MGQHFNDLGVPKEELLCGLAEECSELAQAALKLRRVLTQVSPTPVDEKEALEHVFEEIGDVLLYLDQLNFNEDGNYYHYAQAKYERWVDRLVESKCAGKDFCEIDFGVK